MGTMKTRTNIVTTIHTIVFDVPNPCAEFANKRKKYDNILLTPVFKKGWRAKIRRDYSYNERIDDEIEKRTNLEYCVVEMRIIDRERLGGFTWYEYRNLEDQTVQVEFTHKHDRDSAIETKRADARDRFGAALLAALSKEPEKDYDAIMADGWPRADDVLKRLWLLGMVSLDTIVELRRVIAEETEKQYAAEKAAEEKTNG